MSEEKNHYLSKKESRKIASENKRFIRVLEKNKRRKADETEYTATLEPVAHAPRAGAAGTDRGRRDSF